MYKTANRNNQFAASHIPLAELANGEQELSASQERENLVKKWQKLTEENKHVTDKKKRKENGIKLFELQQKIQAIKPKKKMQGLGQYMLDIIKERYTKSQWNLLVEEAMARMEAKKESISTTYDQIERQEFEQADLL